MKHNVTPVLVLVLALLASLGLAPPGVLAHGHLRSITIDGKLYMGNEPSASSTFSSPIRLVDDVTPIEGALNRAINCGKNAQIAALVVPAKPGSTITFDWASGTDGIWPHNIGPMLTYLSTCGDTTCDKFDAINARWFKIDQKGQRPNDLSQWFQDDLYNGKTTSVELPKYLAAGDYLIRHEIIALQLANLPGGAQFFPSCSQLRVSGSAGNNYTAVLPSLTVSLPGAYSDTDPGIFVPTIFDPVQNYQFPGPAISNVVNGSGTPAAATTSNSTTGTGTGFAAGNIYPSPSARQLSRIMVKL